MKRMERMFRQAEGHSYSAQPVIPKSNGSVGPEVHVIGLGNLAPGGRQQRSLIHIAWSQISPWGAQTAPFRRVDPWAVRNDGLCGGEGTVNWMPRSFYEEYSAYTVFEKPTAIFRGGRMRTYRTLALVGTFIKVIGWLTAIGTVLLACGGLVLAASAASAGMFAWADDFGRFARAPLFLAAQIVPAVILIVSGLVIGALEVAAGELIELFIDMSVSSQRSAQLLEALARQALPPAPLPTPPLPPESYPA
jgi:hypothetical protein